MINKHKNILYFISALHFQDSGQIQNENKLLKQKFNANAINVQNSKSMTLTIDQQQYLFNVNEHETKLVMYF